MQEIFPTPTVSDEKHKSATNRALVLEVWITPLVRGFQPLKQSLGRIYRKFAPLGPFSAPAAPSPAS
ncbi:hypothetical protein Z947_1368 [Sulfitobacter geojensis]|nr:hypothetical protein Z947_1368 [Sulfitobacter geojensis]